MSICLIFLHFLLNSSSISLFFIHVQNTVIYTCAKLTVNEKMTCDRRPRMSLYWNVCLFKVIQGENSETRRNFKLKCIKTVLAFRTCRGRRRSNFELLLRYNSAPDCSISLKCGRHELPTDLCEPHQIQTASLLPPITRDSSSSSPSSQSPLSSSLTRSVFRFELAYW